MRECSHSGKYLGHAFYNFKSKTQAFKEVVNKMADKLAEWKKKALSLAGRIVLIKSIAQALPSYIMQSILAPKSVTTKMDAMIRDFFWGG